MVEFIKIISFLFVCTSLNIRTLAQDGCLDNVEQRILTVLTEEGFENVAVSCKADSIFITYENRVYRYEIMGIKELMNLVSEFIDKHTILVLIPQSHGIPIVALIMNSKDFVNASQENEPAEVFVKDIEVTYDYEKYRDELKNKRMINPSTLKFDIVVYPQFHAQFGNYDDPVESQINLAPALTTSLWKGMSLFMQWIIPLQNELGGEGDQGRPGLLTLNQVIRIPNNTFISTTLGYFTQHRYGLDIETKSFFVNGRLSLGTNVGCTGYALFMNRTWYYSDIEYWTYFINCGYRFPEIDFSIKATYGKFLYEDKGWRFDVIRQFGEIDIGFFMIKTTGVINGGFNL